MIWHDHANKILDMKERKDQIEYYKALSKELQGPVGTLVKMQKDAAKYGCKFVWRDNHEKLHPENKLALWEGFIHAATHTNHSLSVPNCARSPSNRSNRAKRLPNAGYAHHRSNVFPMGDYRKRNG